MRPPARGTADAAVSPAPDPYRWRVPPTPFQVASLVVWRDYCPDPVTTDWHALDVTYRLDDGSSTPLPIAAMDHGGAYPVADPRQVDERAFDVGSLSRRERQELLEQFEERQ